MIYHLAEKILYSFEYSPEDQMKKFRKFASINFSIRSSCLPTKISLESLGTYDLVQMNKESDFLNEDKKYLEPLIGGMTKDSQKAKKLLQVLRKYSSLTKKEMLVLGVLLINYKKFSDAKNILTDSCLAGSYLAKNLVGDIHTRTYDFISAIRSYQKSLDQQPNEGAYLGLSNAYMKTGKPELALESMKHCVSISPSSDKFMQAGKSSSESKNILRQLAAPAIKRNQR